MVTSVALRVARTVSLLLLATFGTVMFMHLAPGYFTDEGEMDARFAATAQARSAQQAQAEGTSLHVWFVSLRAAARGDLGTSRQYQVPVRELLAPRLRVTASLIALALAAGSSGAFLAALLCSGLRSAAAQRGVTLLTALAICIPVSALATLCLLSGHGGPVLILSGVIAARDFRFFSRLLRQARGAHHLAYARACGIPPARLVLRHLLVPMARDLAALVAMSCVVAISAAIPVEVMFDVAGVGQFAWSAVMNRDLPVLFSITALLAACIAGTTLITYDARPMAEAR